MLRKKIVHVRAAPGSERRAVTAVERIDEADPVAIGDQVNLVQTGNGEGWIVEVLPRRNKLSRRASGSLPLEQVIAANVDQMMTVIAAALPAPYLAMLDALLADAEAAEIPAVICITRMDLIDEWTIADDVEVYKRLGYPVLLTSAESGVGIDEARAALTGKMTALLGNSGVGKSTLLNCIQPELGLRVGEVSLARSEGRHTTSHVEMFELEGGGYVIDTPGMRQFGLWGRQEGDPGYLYPEIRDLVGRCRFGSDCSHTHEPGCAIKEAVKRGDLVERRYQSYLGMTGGREMSKEDRARERRARGKRISTWRR